MSMETARCWELSATILFQAGDHEVALLQMAKALAIFWQVRKPLDVCTYRVGMCLPVWWYGKGSVAHTSLSPSHNTYTNNNEQVGGIDCFEAINAHHTLALFHASLRGHNAEAIQHFKACLYLLELVAGPHSPELPSQYQRLASALQELGLVQEAFAAVCAAYEKARRCPDPLMEAQHAHHLALMEAAFGLYKEALGHEKRAYAVFKELFGEGHQRTMEANLCMSAFTSKAVEAATSRQSQQRAQLAAMHAGGMGGGGTGGKGGKGGGGGNRAVNDEWVSESPVGAAGGGGGGGGAGKKKKKGGKKK